MTKLAKQIMTEMDLNKGVDAVGILATGVGSSEAEVAFIMAQINIARGVSG